MNPGKMRRRATFQARLIVDDGYGNVVGGWEDRFQRWCGVRYLRGSETVMAARLSARQPILVTIRQDSQTALIMPDWRVLIGDVPYQIREPLRPSEDLRNYEILCEGGVAT